MPSQSKEEQVLKLIFENSPMKEWHFEEIVREAKVTRAVANKWLRKYVKQGIIKRQKKKGRFPVYSAGKDNVAYQSHKRVHGLRKLYDSGLVEELLKLPGAKTIIIFGSIARGDWYKESDIDIFVLGGESPENLRNVHAKAHKLIEVHHFNDIKELNTIRNDFLLNVIDGHLIKGTIEKIAEAAIEKKRLRRQRVLQ
jgi:predicted nucleotidyltransferase